MKTVIYLDTLLLVNFLIGYLLLRAAGLLAGQRPAFGRNLAGGAAAALSTLILLAPELPFWGQLLYQGVSALVIVRLAFGWRGLRVFFRRGALYLALNLLLAGAVAARCSRGGAGLWQTNNLSVYADLPPVLLALCVGGVYLAARLFCVWAGRPGQELFHIAFTLRGRRVEGLAAFYDTGFEVKDPYTGLPAFLAALPALKNKLPPGLEEALARGLVGEAPGAGIRLVACSTALGGGLLPGVTVEEITLRKEGREEKLKKATLLVAGEKLADGRFDVIFGSSLAGGW